VAVVVLNNAQWARARLARSYASEHAHHEARTESIRNIGIIAHVDAVRLVCAWRCELFR
jgi:elongation factor G